MVIYERFALPVGLQSARILADIACVMKAGGCHARTQRFYTAERGYASRARRLGIDFCGGRASVTAAESDAGLGRDPGRDEYALAGRRQKCGRAAWAAVAGAIVCAVIGLDVVQDVFLTAHGGVYQRERGGATVSGFTGWRAGPGAGSLGDRASRSGVGGGGQGGGQRPGPQNGGAVGVHGPPDVVGRYDSAGAGDWVSERTGDLERLGRADRAGIEEAQRAGGEGGASGARPSERDLPGGQAPSSVCQNEGGEAAGADRAGCPQRSVERAGPGDQPAGE